MAISYFRAQAGIGQSVLEAWNNPDVQNSHVPLGCVRPDINMPCDVIYRNEILTKWEKTEIQEVCIVVVQFYV